MNPLYIKEFVFFISFAKIQHQKNLLLYGVRDGVPGGLQSLRRYRYMLRREAGAGPDRLTPKLPMLSCRLSEAGYFLYLTQGSLALPGLRSPWAYAFLPSGPACK